MFSGIVEEVGVIKSFNRSATDAARIIIAARIVLTDTQVGGSIAVDGVCQTVVAIEKETLTIDSVGATLHKTTLGSFSAGRRVNLERPIAYGNRVDGHLVQGHVNDTGTISRQERIGAAYWLEIRLPRPLLPYVVLEGSIAIDGVSLTVASLQDDCVGFSIIPHTARETALMDRHAGHSVNVEVDMIAKYVERLASPQETTRIDDTENHVNDGNDPVSLASVDEAAQEIARGQMVLMIDDADRENEGDLVAAASLVTPRIATCMLRQASGLLCAAITNAQAKQLELPPMTSKNTALHGTHFTVSVDALKGTTTGESAHDRATTLRALANPKASPSEFARPGHVFPLVADPGGVAARPGHTEAAVDLVTRAGLPPAAAICPVLDDEGGMARRIELSRLAHRLGIPILHVSQLTS